MLAASICFERCAAAARSLCFDVLVLCAHALLCVLVLNRFETLHTHHPFSLHHGPEGHEGYEAVGGREERSTSTSPESNEGIIMKFRNHFERIKDPL